MFKAIIHLKNDLSANAGQVLVVRDNGVVHVVDQRQIEEAIGLVVKPSESVKEIAAPKRSEDHKTLIARMLLANCSVKKICTTTGVTRDEVMQQRKKMSELGLVHKDSNHHWYKSPEKVEAARKRALHMLDVKMARRQEAIP